MNSRKEMDNFQEQYIPPTLKLGRLISSLSIIVTGTISSELISSIGSVKKNHYTGPM